MLMLHRLISLKKPFLCSPKQLQNVRCFVNHYDTLEVDPTASSDEIRQSYIAKCKEFHPDKHQGDVKMQKKFVQIHAAYKVLSNPVSRRSYDNTTWINTGSKPFSKHMTQDNVNRNIPHNVTKQTHAKFFALFVTLVVMYIYLVSIEDRMRRKQQHDQVISYIQREQFYRNYVQKQKSQNKKE
uniref:Uncharacterized protein LOC104266622 n=1 Tax=Phallusia mammillata TaxID=59560 RepID=A0A6F9DII1_9ASCI|nr:uncharacterized protein LOC104266622 [Phallusia mammillata]